MKSTIKKIIQENQRVRTFIVEPEIPVTFKTGQAMKWNIPGMKVGRLYSIASPGGENKKELWFTIALERDGRFTPHVWELTEGDAIELSGPFGRFFFEPSERDIALIAGGSGISVMRSILKYVLDNGLKNQTNLIFSILTVHDTIYKEELEQLTKEHKNFTYSIVVTEKHLEWRGRCGFVTKQMFDEDFGDYSQDFYICGPGAFMDCSVKILKEANVADERIHIDQWSFYKKNE